MALKTQPWSWGPGEAGQEVCIHLRWGGPGRESLADCLMTLKWGGSGEVISGLSVSVECRDCSGSYSPSVSRHTAEVKAVLVSWGLPWLRALRSYGQGTESNTEVGRGNGGWSKTWCVCVHRRVQVRVPLTKTRAPTKPREGKLARPPITGC